MNSSSASQWIFHGSFLGNKFARMFCQVLQQLLKLKRMISYLAGPYSSIHIHIRDRRYQQLSFVAAELIKRGELIYSPITACHHLAADYDLPMDANFWLNHNLAFLSKCDKLIVLQLEGWENSVGVQREIEFATEHNIPIEYVTMGEFGGNKS